MPFDLILLPLLGGYWFSVRFNRSRYLATRHTRDRLVFLSATAGLGLVALSYLGTRFLIGTAPSLAALFKGLAPWPYSGTALGSLLLGLSLPLLLNRWFPEDRENVRAILRYGTSLERLFCEATETGHLIIVTTESRKVYVGYPKWIPPLHIDDGFVRILPLQSGYRESESLQVQLDTNYTEAFEQIIERCGGDLPDIAFDDFVKVLPACSIASAGLFNPNAFDHFRELEASDSTPATGATAWMIGCLANNRFVRLPAFRRSSGH